MPCWSASRVQLDSSQPSSTKVSMGPMELGSFSLSASTVSQSLRRPSGHDMA